MTSSSSRALCVVVIVGIGCAGAVLAQGQRDTTDAANSLADLTTEVRQLRLAVEESTRNQTQVQALSVYLSVQQGRIAQATMRMESVRKELETAVAQSREIALRLTNIEAELRRVSEPVRRAAVEDRQQQLRAEQERLVFLEQQVRIREGEASQVLESESSRWLDLISRLEQLIKR